MSARKVDQGKSREFGAWRRGKSTKSKLLQYFNSARYIKFKFQNGLRTSIELNEGIFKTGRKQKAVKKLFAYFTFTQCELLSAMIK